MKEFLDQSLNDEEKIKKAIDHQTVDGDVESGKWEDAEDLINRKNDRLNNLSQDELESDEATLLFGDINPANLPIDVLKNTFENEIDEMKNNLFILKDSDDLSGAEMLIEFNELSEAIKEKEEWVQKMEKYIKFHSNISFNESAKNKNSEPEIDPSIFDQKISKN